MIENMHIKLKVNRSELKQNKVDDCICTLGVHIGPSRETIEQFKVMKVKMCKAINKNKTLT